MLDNENTSLSRISRDGKKNIVKSGDKYVVLSTEDNSIINTDTSLTPLVASGSWRRVTKDERENYVSFVPKSARKDFDPVISDQEAEQILEEETAEDNEEADSIPDVEVGEEDAELSENPEVYDFNENFDFFATPYDADQTNEYVTGVYALDPDTQELFWWEDGEFQHVNENDIDPYLPEHWILVDNETAQFIADWQDHRTDEEPCCSVFGNDPDEHGLFESSESEIDWEFIDDLSAVVADASGYSPVERSRNATKQRRGPGGRFARTPGKTDNSEPANSDTRAPEIKKTYLPAKRDIVLLPNPLNFIVDFIDGASPSSGPAIGGGVAVTAAGPADGPLPEIGKDAQEMTREDTAPSPDAVYFAIVHKDDNKAVQDLIAVTKSEKGSPQAWKRINGDWAIAPEVLADLQSVTPPPVVELDEETAQLVLTGIDEYESNKKPEEGAEEQQPIQASSFQEAVRKGYSLYDGTFLIKNQNDLFTAVRLAPENASLELKQHIVKRARALNRMDVVPSDWRTVSLVSETPLFNTYGEVITAAGGKRGGNAETLRQYWSSGKGAAKIGWGTEGDLTRCHRKLSKYMPGRSWGYCQNLHMRKYGKSNYKKDNG